MSDETHDGGVNHGNREFEPQRIKKGSSRARRFFKRLGIMSARQKRHENSTCPSCDQHIPSYLYYKGRPCPGCGRRLPSQHIGGEADAE